MHSIPFVHLMKDHSIKERVAFLERHRTASLVIEEVADRPPSEFDGKTPFVLPNWWRPTPVHPGRKTRAPHPLHRYGSVVWLEKTRRNPFENLITLGRAPNNDIRYPLEALSKLHATFARSGERWQVQDNSSRNGTFVNDEPLAPGKFRELKDGDQVRFCPELRARFFSAPALYDFVALVGRMTPRD
jgi:hypothetical protein